MKEIDTSALAAHVLVCTNRRAPEDPLPCCAAADGERVFAQLRELVAAAGLSGRVWVNRAGCLGWCHSAGCTVAIYPVGVMLQRVALSDCATIFARHIAPLAAERR